MGLISYELFDLELGPGVIWTLSHAEEVFERLIGPLPLILVLVFHCRMVVKFSRLGAWRYTYCAPTLLPHHHQLPPTPSEGKLIGVHLVKRVKGKN